MTSHQAGFNHFVDGADEPEPEPEADDSPEEWGPTMDEPAHWIAPDEFVTLPGSDADPRQLPGTGLSPEEFQFITPWDSGPEKVRKVATGEHPDIHPDDRHRPDRIEQWAEKAAELGDQGAETTHPDAGGEEQALATDGGETIEATPVADPENPPKNETVLLIQGITRVMHTPKTVEGETSTSGKTISVDLDSGESVRLDASEIFAGESEFRDAKYFEIYTPARFRKNQRSNHAPGPQAGANEVSDPGDLPDPTHWPTLDEPADAPDECPNCGAERAPWNDKRRPVCEACGEMLPVEGEDQDDETADMPTKWDLSRLDRGDVLILEGYRGEFVITRIHHFQGTHTVNRLEAAKREGGEWRTYDLEKLDSMKGHRLKVEREGETNPFVNVDDPDHARDFEVVGNDMDRVRSYIRNSRDA